MICARRSGFTLIELMIVMGITLAALLAASPFAADWSNQSKINQSLGEFREAYARTRSTALLNKIEATGTASAVLCKSGSSIFIHPGVPATCGISSGANAAIWSNKLPNGVNVYTTSASAPFVCFGLSSSGLPVSTSVASQACSVATQFRIIKGSVDSGQIDAF